MANKKSSKRNASKPPSTKSQRRSGKPPRSVGASLDAAGAAYAKLLSDPCSAPLVHAPYGSTEQGYLTRFSSEITLSGVHGSCFFVPSSLVPSTKDGTGTAYSFNYGSVGFGSSASPDTAMSITSSLPATVQPGFQFLQGVAETFRPVAACLTATYVGSEMNRAGVIGVGQFKYGSLFNQDGSAANIVTPNRLLSSFPKSSRVSDEKIEVKLRPTDSTAKWQEIKVVTNQSTDVASQIFSDYLEDHGDDATLSLAWSGVPDGSVRVKFVVVYEWMPKTDTALSNSVAGNGVMQSVSSAPKSRHSVADIIGALDRTGHWMYETSHNAAQALSSLWHGGRAVKALAQGTSRLMLTM